MGESRSLVQISAEATSTKLEGIELESGRTGPARRAFPARGDARVVVPMVAVLRRGAVEVLADEVVAALELGPVKRLADVLGRAVHELERVEEPAPVRVRKPADLAPHVLHGDVEGVGVGVDRAAPGPDLESQ